MPESVDLKNPHLSPFWEDTQSLQKLPPTDIIFGQFDRLRSDAQAYSQRLEQVGVDVQQMMVEQANHSLLWYRFEVVPTIAQRLRAIFHVELKRPLSSDDLSAHRMIILKGKPNPLEIEEEEPNKTVELPRARL